MEKLKFLVFGFIFRREVGTMAEIYAALIIKGVRKFSQVPAIIQPKVREVLEVLDLAELAEG